MKQKAPEDDDTISFTCSECQGKANMFLVITIDINPGKSDHMYTGDDLDNTRSRSMVLRTSLQIFGGVCHEKASL